MYHVKGLNRAWAFQQYAKDDNVDVNQVEEESP